MVLPTRTDSLSKRGDRHDLAVDLDDAHSVEPTWGVGYELEIDCVFFAFAVAFDLQHRWDVVGLSASDNRAVGKA